jgi:hypothetical protein
MSKAARQFKPEAAFLLPAVLCAMLGAAGCSGGREPAEVAGSEVRLPGDLSRAVEAAGGGAWAAAHSVRGDCVATFYRPDGTFYLTWQHHEIRPLAGSILITAEEPRGGFAWLLSADGFRKLRGPDVYTEVCNPHFAGAVLEITAAPARFLSRPGDLAVRGDPVRIEGLRYRPIETVGGPGPRAVYYQAAGGRVDRIRLARPGQNEFIAARGYDYTLIEGKGVIVPATVEVFSCGGENSTGTRLAKIEYHSLR